MPNAGERIIAGRVPSERIATAVETTDSGDFTAVTTVMTVVSPLVDGRTYKVVVDAAFESAIAGDVMDVHIRQGSVAGTVLKEAKHRLASPSGIAWPIHLEVEFPATSTGAQTFVLTGELANGTGPLQLSGNPSYLYVEYIRG